MRKYHRSLLWLKLLLSIIKDSLKQQPFGTSALKTSFCFDTFPPLKFALQNIIASLLQLKHLPTFGGNKKTHPANFTPYGLWTVS